MAKQARRLCLFLLTLLAVGGLAGCSSETTARGPGIDVKTGAITAPGDTVMVGLTNAVLGDDTWDNMGFWLASVDVVSGLEQQPGFIGYAVKTSLTEGYAKTMTLWQDEASLDAFVKSEPHRTAMRDYRHVLADGTSFARFSRAKELGAPTWAEAEDVLAKQGVRSY